MSAVEITLWTDPACPFAFSAEPVRRRLRWLYGDQLTWIPRMIVLTREPGEAEKLAEGADGLQEAHGMPIARGPLPRAASSEPACRAVVAARTRAGNAAAERLLRRLRVLTMLHHPLDDPATIARAASDAGLEPDDVAGDATIDEALEADAAGASSPAAAARALDHKLGGSPGARRYTAPSYELRRGGTLVVVPGFNPAATYETAIANLAPDLARRGEPQDMAELLQWAGDEPLATAEAAAIAGLDRDAAREALAGAGRPEPAGADSYWHAPEDNGG